MDGVLLQEVLNSECCHSPDHLLLGAALEQTPPPSLEQTPFHVLLERRSYMLGAGACLHSGT
jgi:hypothetical protein